MSTRQLRFFLIVIFLSLAFVSYAQESTERDYYNKGIGYGVQGSFQKAKEEFQKGLNVSHPYSTPLNAAIDIAQDALNNKIKKNTAIYLFRGTNYANKFEFDKAIGDFTKAIRMEPKYAASYNSRGTVYLLKGELENALDDFNQVIKRNPDYPKAYLNRANVYAKMGLEDAALADMGKALQLNTRYPEAYYSRALLYHNTGRYGQAIVDYTRAIDLYVKFENAYYGRGLAYLLKSLYNESLADFNEVLKLNPDNILAVFHKATVLEKVGSKDEAVKAYSEFVKKAPLRPDYRLYVNLIEKAKEAIARIKLE